jgi:hypothetical protein
MLKICFVRPGRIIVKQRKISPPVGAVQTVELGQCNGLDDSETLRGSVPQEHVSFGWSQSVEKLPGCICQIEERCSVVIDEEPPIRADLRHALVLFWEQLGGHFDFEDPGLGVGLALVLS